MKRVQVWGWLLSGFLRKHKKIIFLGMTMGIAFAIFAIWVFPYIPRPKPVTKIGLVGQYYKNNMPLLITSKVSQGLTAILKDGSAAPALADHWEISDDNKKYTFVLRDKLYWQDGSPVTVKDINYNYQEVNIEKPNDDTIIFTLKDQFAPFPTLLSRPLFKNGNLGTGEYRITSIKEKGGYLDTVRLEGSNEVLVYRFYPNLKIASTAFLLGEVESLQDLNSNPFENDTTQTGVIQVKNERNYNQFVALFLNKADPLLKDKGFRQALAYATKKPTDESRAFGPISIQSWAYNSDLKPYEYEKKRALDLMEKSFGSLEKAQEVTLNLSTTQFYLSKAEEIKKNWEETLGIKVDVSVINTFPQNYQILLMAQDIPYDPDQYIYWHSKGQLNKTSMDNVRIDKLLEDGRTNTEDDKRLEIYSDFQRFFVEESQVIFLYYPQTYSITRKSVIKPYIQQVIQMGKENI